MQVVYNTCFGELWEDRGDLEDEDSLMARREEYPAELPEGVLVLTAGVDTQDDRMEYEIVGHGHFGETWGIEKGIVMGRDVYKRQEHILAYIHYHQLPLPPIYGWKNGYLCGTHPWPARQWTGSIENGWREVYDIDPGIVLAAAEKIDSARAFLKGVQA